MRLTWISGILYTCTLFVTAIRDLTVYKINQYNRKNDHRKVTPDVWYRKLMRRYDDEDLSSYIELGKVVTNSAISIGYVYTTYTQRLTTPIVVLNMILGTILAIDYIREIAVAHRSFLLVLRFESFCQIFSFPSLFLSTGETKFLNFAFLRAWAAYSSFRKLERRSELSSATSRKYERFVQLVIQFFVLFYLLAGGYQLVEYPGDLFGQEFGSDEWNFFNSFWFIVVTLSTVGYGDFSPDTIQGRIFVVLMIVVTINIFYNEVKDIMTETSQNTVGSGKFRSWRKNGHVIITGSPTLNEIMYFLSEFFSIYSNSKLSNEHMKIVVLVEDIKWDIEDWHREINKNVNLIGIVTLLVGCYDDKLSFERACIEKAAGIFILTSSSHDSNISSNTCSYEKDHKTMNTALSIRKVNPKIPIYSQALLDSSKVPMKRALQQVHHDDTGITRSTLNIYNILVEHENWKTPKELDDIKHGVEKSIELDDHEVKSQYVCIQRLYTALLVANIRANGVSTLCTNMFFDFGLAEFDSKKPWLAEYLSGAACKLLPAVVPENLDGVSLSEVLPLLFRRGIILMGLKKENFSKINVVTDLNVRLIRGQVGMFLTYLDLNHLCIAIRLVGEEYKEGVDRELCKNFKSKHREDSIWNDLLLEDRDSEITEDQQSKEIRPLEKDRNQFSFYSFFNSSGNDVPTAMEKQRRAIKSLKNHVIIALDFEEESSVTERLSLFLKLLWKNDGMSDDRVVVIHPTFWKDISCNEKLFFIRGSPSKPSSWEEANISNAKAVISLADMNQNHSVTDSSILYMLIMLEKEVEAGKNVFFCSELLDERSVRFFRVPNSRKNRRIQGEDGILRSETDYNLLQILKGEEPENVEKVRKQFKFRTRHETEKFENDKSDLFSATRYASGELLIHSTSNSFLAREFLEPGFIEFMMSLCGGSEEEPGQNIFLLKMPNSIFKEFSAEYVEFGIIFELLIRLNVIPLGIYRHGDAPVLLPKTPKRRVDRGAGVLSEATKLSRKRNSNTSHEPSKKDDLQLQGEHTFDSGCSYVEPILQEEQKSGNILPYVYTLPEPNSLVSSKDGVFVLGDSSKAIEGGFRLSKRFQ